MGKIVLWLGKKVHSWLINWGMKIILMGMKPDQSRFFRSFCRIQLDESPVVAKGFNRQLPIGGTMAIEPKVVYFEGSIGVEDTWIKTSEEMKCLTRLETHGEKFISEV
jgi:hypothetical protein